MELFEIKQHTKDETVNIVLDTLERNKQALIFTSSKASAEKTAEDIAKHLKTSSEELNTLATEIEEALQTPTKQCLRLGKCVRKGVAFHHAGLVQKQKEAIEDAFREGKIKIIAATPTLCLSQDTMIWSAMEEVKISHFNVDLPVFGLFNNQLGEMKVKGINKLENTEKLIEIVSVSNYSVKATQNHKFLIKRKGKKLTTQAKDIKKRDKIATIGRISVDKTTKSFFGDFIKENSLPFKNKEMDQNVCYVIGAMLGDGYSGAEFLNNKIRYKGSPCIVGIDQDIFNEVKTFCKNQQLSCNEKKNYHGTPQLILGKNKWFREFLCRCGVEKGEQKQIAKALMYLDLEKTANLLQGLFDTDGYVKKLHNVGFSNISEKLIKQMQKLLLRFGIVTYIRKRNASSMKIFEKEYKTKEYYELLITQKKSILDFYKYVGFKLQRKQDDLINLVAKIVSNVHCFECENCQYKIYQDLFSGRSKEHKEWGLIKERVIKVLAEKGELGSRDLVKILGREPKKKDTRLNHHYELITKRRNGARSRTERYWSLNKIGEWIYLNILKEGKNVNEFLKLQECPLCKEKLEIHIKKGWRDKDFEGDIYWDTVRSVKEINTEKEVYDVVLPMQPKNDHMFVANGFIVHNSIGVDLPSYRTIIKSLKRYSGQRGMQYIPVLEYHQMAGRSGRPGKDTRGEALTIASTEAEKESIYEKYIIGDVEEIYSKLAVEPVLRTYILSLIASKFVRTREEIFAFFEKTFWAHQFQDMQRLNAILQKMLKLLESFRFIHSSTTTSEFISAADLNTEKYNATEVGERVSQLYLDPLTAHMIITALEKAQTTEQQLTSFNLLQLFSATLELRPLLKIKTKDYEEIEKKYIALQDTLLTEKPIEFDIEYEEYLSSIKTALFFSDWIEERSEEFLLEKYDARPGEIREKLEKIDWICYATLELSKMLQLRKASAEIHKLRVRLEYGAREELLPLLKLKNIGKIRARKLFNNKIKDIGDVKKADLATLTQLLGPAIAVDIKKQVGEKVENIEIKPTKRKGQMSLGKYIERTK